METNFGIVFSKLSSELEERRAFVFNRSQFNSDWSLFNLRCTTTTTTIKLTSLPARARANVTTKPNSFFPLFSSNLIDLWYFPGGSKLYKPNDCSLEQRQDFFGFQRAHLESETNKLAAAEILKNVSYHQETLTWSFISRRMPAFESGEEA